MPTVVAPGAGIVPTFSHPAVPTVEVKLDGRAGAGFSLIEYVVPPGFAPPPVLHRHTRESATGYVIDGHLTYWFDDGEAHDVGPGTVVHLPAGAWFRWANTTDEQVRLLFMFQPAGFEQFFLEPMAGIADAGGDPAAIGSLIHPLRTKYGDEQHPD